MVDIATGHDKKNENEEKAGVGWGSIKWISSRKLKRS